MSMWMSELPRPLAQKLSTVGSLPFNTGQYLANFEKGIEQQNGTNIKHHETQTPLNSNMESPEIIHPSSIFPQLLGVSRSAKLPHPLRFNAMAGPSLLKSHRRSPRQKMVSTTNTYSSNTVLDGTGTIRNISSMIVNIIYNLIYTSRYNLLKSNMNT